ncbi:oligosaccharide flippase family protein [Vibrio parahaemolyticus]|nr:oligosaccharide flippase family protein [Vibrio parahaemolyticus]MDF4670392.1 oligosaccharide flippase family protein [Vibrio parahaemolyticus]HAV1413275.1 oligosaccharide flippase family protein [Vibrio parahaemolyticus]HAV2006194.1 oligosaccharide flippase family protein [Vibrio parahaemolyticus]
MKYIKVLLSGALWNVVGGFINKSSMMLIFIYIANTLGTTKYGMFSIIQSNVMLFGTFAGLGLGQTAIKLISEQSNIKSSKDVASKVIYVFLSSYIIMSVIVGCLAEKIIGLYNLEVGYVYLIYWAIPLMFFITNQSIMGSILIGLKNFKLNSIIQAAPGISFIVLLLTFDEFRTINDLLFMWTSSYVLSLLLFLFYYVRVGIENNSVFERISLKTIFSICIPITLSSLIVVPVNWYVNIILAGLDNGIEEIGLFNAANQWRNIIMFLPMMLSPVMLTHFNNKHVGDKYYKLKVNLIINGSVSFFIVLLLSFSNGIFSYIYSDGYSNIHELVMLIGISTALIVVNTCMGQFLIHINKVKKGLLFNTIWAVIYVFLIFTFKKHGAIGVGYALAGSYIIHTIVQFSYVYYLYYKEYRLNLC